jgi:hypothetical protein
MLSPHPTPWLVVHCTAERGCQHNPLHPLSAAMPLLKHGPRTSRKPYRCPQNCSNQMKNLWDRTIWNVHTDVSIFALCLHCPSWTGNTSLFTCSPHPTSTQALCIPTPDSYLPFIPLQLFPPAWQDKLPAAPCRFPLPAHCQPQTPSEHHLPGGSAVGRFSVVMCSTVPLPSTRSVSTFTKVSAMERRLIFPPLAGRTIGRSLTGRSPPPSAPASSVVDCSPACSSNMPSVGCRQA